MATGETTNIQPEYNSGNTGLNMDNTPSQIKKGVLTYALNAAVENFDASSVNYQNEPGNELCLQFPTGYISIGDHFIPEQNKHIFFLVSPETGGSEIGHMDNNDCIYRTYINADCLNFDIDHPIMDRVVHKITNCTTEIYWTDNFNRRRYMDLDNIPYTLVPGTDLCDPVFSNELDCNRLEVQPTFSIPTLKVVDVITGGDLVAGTYQFAFQYSNATGNGYTSYYSVTNPTPIANPQITTLNFNYQVGKSIVLEIEGVDQSGYFQYFNIAVIKTINGITSAELVGTFSLDEANQQIIYTGQNQELIQLTVNDILEQFPYYELANDVTTSQDMLIWANLTSIDRINYQNIANQITLQWQSYRIPNTETYADEVNATNLRGYLRDEVYPFEIVFILKNGKRTDGFHIPGRLPNIIDTQSVPNTDPDYILDPSFVSSPYWKIYNTANILGTDPGYTPDPTYKGNYQHGEFAYWESTDTYPCNKEMWGDLADLPIRHHKFPDVLVSPIFESAFFIDADSMAMQQDAIFPLGVRLDLQQVSLLITNSNLTQEQKDSIAGFKIIRGDRTTNKSIIGKGIIRNVGKYTRDDTEYLYPNYPYNDLRVDPFLLTKSNAYTSDTAGAGLSSSPNGICREFVVYATTDCIIEYLDCFTNNIVVKSLIIGETFTFCANNIPITTVGTAYIISHTYTKYSIRNTTVAAATFTIIPFENTCTSSGGYPSRDAYCRANPTTQCCSNSLHPIDKVAINDPTIMYSLTYPKYKVVNVEAPHTIEILENIGYELCAPEPLEGFEDESLKYRLIFQSPETSFGQPFLGDVIKMENVIFGAGTSHFVQVKDNSLFRMISREAQQDALDAAYAIATISDPDDYNVLFAAYQAYLTIYIAGIPRKNFAYSFNSIASYDYHNIISNGLGIKQRRLDNAQYLIPAVQSIGDNININNWNRESTVYLKTDDAQPSLPFAQDTPSMLGTVIDDSRYVISTPGRGDCNAPGKESPIHVIAYYASLKNTFINQWGQIYSYQVADTGHQALITDTGIQTIFGGDTFIGKFAYKSKLPFFIDNRVGAPDDSDIFYDEIGNVAYPKYWYSSRSILSDYTVGGITLTNFISIKAHNLDCPNTQEPHSAATPNPGRTFYDGKMYLFAYGIPYFYCESSINLDLRQAFNNREGDFYPHVSKAIPDDWVQESFVSIAQDNTYYYNTTYSKQNKETAYSHLPTFWTSDLCLTNFPFRAIYSDPQNINPTIYVNNWLTYRADSFFDFPQTYGKLISLDGIQNRMILARFENKSLLYDALLTINTSNPQAAYIGNNTLFRNSPPIDFAETDLGYVGCQNRMLLKIPYGQITTDAKRGQVFLISGQKAEDLTGFGSGVNRFFTDHLAFEIAKYFPTINTDNNYKGIGLHGVYDSKYDRIIITKLDYIPTSSSVKYDEETKTFYLERLVGEVTLRDQVYLDDRDYFCNKSFTMSFNFNTKAWISFHSYLPNWYLGENNFFYSGINSCCGVDGDFLALVGTPTETTTTTSTSSTSTTSTSSTTTTTTTINCTLVGDAVEQDCILEGTAEELPCDCITFENTSLVNAPVEWVSCTGALGFQNLLPSEILEICGREPNTFDNPFVTISIANPCFEELGDFVCTTTTTTLYPCNCITFQNFTGFTGFINWDNCFNEADSESIDIGETKQVCGSNPTSDILGILIGIGGSCAPDDGDYICTTTTTTTTPPTTTTTTTLVPGIFIFVDSPGSIITDVDNGAGGYFYFISIGAFPLNDGESLSGTVGAYTGNLRVFYTSGTSGDIIYVRVNGIIQVFQPVSVGTSTHTFIGVTWAAGANVQISIEN